MPGPIKNAGANHPSLRTDNAIVSAVEIIPDDIELPSTENYVSTRKRTTKTADGPVDEVEYFWTKKKLGQWLGICPQVPVFIEIDRDRGQTNPKTAPPHPVYYDGFRIDVPVGVRVMVAKPIADVIANMQNEYRTSQSLGIDMYRINPDNPDDHGYEIPALAAVAG